MHLLRLRNSPRLDHQNLSEGPAELWLPSLRATMHLQQPGGPAPRHCSTMASHAQRQLATNGVSLNSNVRVHWLCQNHSTPREWAARISCRTDADGALALQQMASGSAKHAEGLRQKPQSWRSSGTPPPTAVSPLRQSRAAATGKRPQVVLPPPSRVDTRHPRSNSRQHGCSFCCSQQVCPCHSLAARHPTIAAQWRPDLNTTSRLSLAEQCRPKSNMLNGGSIRRPAGSCTNGKQEGQCVRFRAQAAHCVPTADRLRQHRLHTIVEYLLHASCIPGG